MDKKVVIGVCAVIAFFLGAIWVDSCPVVAPLVAFLEVCAGFACGFFFCKSLAKETISSLEEDLAERDKDYNKVRKDLAAYKTENASLMEEISKFTKSAAKSASKKNAKTIKE